MTVRDPLGTGQSLTLFFFYDSVWPSWLSPTPFLIFARLWRCVTFLAQTKVRLQFFRWWQCVTLSAQSMVRPQSFQIMTVHDPLGSVQSLTSIFFNHNSVWPFPHGQGLDLTLIFQHVTVCDPLGMAKVSTLLLCFNLWRCVTLSAWPSSRPHSYCFSKWRCVTLLAWPKSRPHSYFSACDGAWSSTK